MVRQGDTTFQDEAVITPAPILITIARDMSLAGSDVGYTGVGFKPSYMFCTFNENTVVGSGGTSMSFQGGGNGVIFRDRQTTGADTWGLDSGTIYSDQAGGGGVFYTAFILSFDVDGFTLRWAKNGATTGTLAARFIVFK